jgi:hypothetical protein
LHKDDISAFAEWLESQNELGNAFELYWNIAMSTRGLSRVAKCAMMRKGLSVMDKFERLSSNTLEKTSAKYAVHLQKQVLAMSRLCKFTTNEQEKTEVADKMMAKSEGDLSMCDDTTIAILNMTIG